MTCFSRRVATLLLAGQVVLTSVFAQGDRTDLNVLLLPDSLTEHATSVVRKFVETYELTDRNVVTETYHKEVTLLSKKSDENQLVMHYDDDSRITSFSATLYDGLGNKVRAIRKGELNDVLYQDGFSFLLDDRVRYVEVEHDEYPYTIVFEYKKRSTDHHALHSPIFAPQDYQQGVVESELKVIIPQENELFYDANAMPAVMEKRQEGQRIYHWKLAGLRAVEREGYAPERFRVLPSLVTSLKNVELPDGTAGGFTDWDSYGRLKGALYAGRDELPESLVAEIKTLVADASSDREKVDLLYRFMQERMRYVSVQLGIGGWQPFPAAEVEKDRYGDCKALSNYMMAMLKTVDVQSFPTVVYSGRPSYKVHPDFASGYGFNHVILYVPGEDMYLECTSNYLPTGYPSSRTLDRNVLHITPWGGQLARMPAMEPAEHGHLRSQRITLQEDGSAQLDLTTRYVGATHERWRYLEKSISPEELRESLQERDQLPDVNGNHFSFTVSPDEPYADLSYQTTVPRYARKMGKRYFVPVNKLFDYDRRPEKLEKRRFPVVYESPRFLVDSVSITVPEGLRLESMGDEQVDIEHPVGEYHATISQNGNVIQWIRTLKLRKVELPAEAYAEFRAFFLEVGKADRRQLVFKATTK